MFLSKFVLLPLTFNMKRKGKSYSGDSLDESIWKTEQEKENTLEKETLPKRQCKSSW